MVRTLTPDEVVKLLGPGSETVRRWRDPRINPATLASDWAVRVAEGIGSVYGMFEGDILRGFLLATFGRDFHDGAMMGCENLWAVEPGYRNTLEAFDMVDAFEAECRFRKCARVALGIRYDTASKGEASIAGLRRIYDAMGYAPISESFVKQLSYE